MVRVRFAPSPTGPLHMGGVRTALYNYLYAKKLGGTFILRLEDTDQTRFVEGAEEYIVESLKWCGISPDEGIGAGGEHGPYRQSERKALYRPFADQLVEQGHAYYAFDTPEELDAMRERMKQAGSPTSQYNGVTRSSMKNSLTLPQEEVQKKLDSGEPYVIRMKMPRNQEVRFHDEIRGWVVVNTNNMDDKVLMKGDGMPTYHLANVVDDHKMNITHVIRGEEWLPSAPLHIMLYNAFGWEAPKMAHLPLILRPDGNGKLSKRDGDRLGFPVFPINWTTAEGEIFHGYKEAGYFPEAFVNMLAFLGWNPGDNREIFSLQELVDTFSLERVGKSGARFDPDKTKWYNQQYLRAKTGEELATLLRQDQPERVASISDEKLAKMCDLVKERCDFVTQLLDEGEFLLHAPQEYDEKTVRKKWKEGSSEVVDKLIGELDKVETFDSTQVETTFKSFLDDQGLGLGAVLPIFRVLVTGKGQGPSMFDISEFLGKEETLSRLKNGVQTLG